MNIRTFATNQAADEPPRNFAEEFRNRKRADPWRYFLIDLVVFCAIAAFFVVWCGLLTTQVLPIIMPVAVLSYAAWRRPRPVCPNCKKNIQLCRAIHCHVCGHPLKRARCERCDVLQNWTHISATKAETAGNRHAINHCPSCGVLLETDFLRWLGGGMPP